MAKTTNRVPARTLKTLGLIFLAAWALTLALQVLGYRRGGNFNLHSLVIGFFPLVLSVYFFWLSRRANLNN